MAKHYGGGDGSSIENAVILKNFNGEKEKKTLQRKWITDSYPYFIPIQVHHLKKGGKIYECVEYFPYDNDDMKKSTYFDITGLY